ncbi:SUKH-4 family immunity protein [Streptomyces sp. NPDC088725]|uniref:SUKH-4 family immunity protein n=1 Tax=Streptomyces sp. NPDC088725 TaxID=3365873 RepID=UPI003802F487
MTTHNDVPRIPDSDWLEARFGKGSLWRPADAELPEKLTDHGSRTFLTTVGYPSVQIDVINFDSSDLRDDTDCGAMQPFDADELYGRRHHDDESPPVNFCFAVGTFYDQQLMLDAAGGRVDHYDPNGWDHADGYQGAAASSLATLALLLGLVAERREALEAATGDARTAVATELRDRMIETEPLVADSDFWLEVFEYLLDQ